MSKSTIIINLKIIVKFAANIRLFCGYFTLSVNIQHKKYAKLHIFDSGAKITIFLYACKDITKSLNKAI